jgi:hypothetical protein
VPALTSLYYAAPSSTPFSQERQLALTAIVHGYLEHILIIYIYIYR